MLHTEVSDLIPSPVLAGEEAALLPSVFMHPGGVLKQCELPVYGKWGFQTAAFGRQERAWKKHVWQRFWSAPTRAPVGKDRGDTTPQGRDWEVGTIHTYILCGRHGQRRSLYCIFSIALITKLSSALWELVCSWNTYLVRLFVVNRCQGLCMPIFLYFGPYTGNHWIHRKYEHFGCRRYTETIFF